MFHNSEADAVSRSTAVVKQDGDWWLGWVEEVLLEALEINRAEARAAAGGSYEELALAL
jgi:hypothetical protein